MHCAASPRCPQGRNHVSSSDAVSGKNFRPNKGHVSGRPSSEFQRGDSSVPVDPQNLSGDITVFSTLRMGPAAAKRALVELWNAPARASHASPRTLCSSTQISNCEASSGDNMGNLVSVSLCHPVKIHACGLGEHGAADRERVRESKH